MLLKIILDCEDQFHHGHCAHGHPTNSPEHEKCMVRNAGNCPWLLTHPGQAFDPEELDELPDDTWNN